MADFDIDETLDNALEEEKQEKEKQEVEAKNQELENQLKELKDAAEIEKQKQEQEEKEEEASLAELVKKQQEELDQLKQSQTAVVQNQIESGIAELTEKYPDLMSNEDVLAKPALAGSTATVKEYLTELVRSGLDAGQAAESFMLLNNIKPAKTTGTLSRGRTSKGEVEKHNKEVSKSMNKWKTSLRDGTAARRLLAEKNKVDTA